jgi:hypothetical protein
VDDHDITRLSGALGRSLRMRPVDRFESNPIVVQQPVCCLELCIVCQQEGEALRRIPTYLLERALPASNQPFIGQQNA